MKGDHVDLLGSGRSALSTARIAVSYVGPSRDQRPCGLSSPHTQERRILRCCALARRQVPVSSPERKIQRRELLGIPHGVSSAHPSRRPPRGGHQRQCPISPL